MLHVVDGNILISRSPSKAPGSLNGSILFGEIVRDAWPLGEWGIEYYSGKDEYSANGLNFWKVASENNSGANFCLYLTNDGNVGIGTDVTHGYKLAVKGKILAEELKVKLSQNWPDYVFNKNYHLLPLKEVDQFIQTNNHLPDMPSAKEVQDNGVNVGEMNARLVKKVEELTLYLIAMQKEMEQLKVKIASR
jgi:hypothetical protein